MGFMRKQMLLQQRASFEQTLQERMSSLSKKGIQPPKTDKDPIVKKLKADIKAVNKRLRAVAENDKKTEENTKRKADQGRRPQGGGSPQEREAEESLRRGQGQEGQARRRQEPEACRRGQGREEKGRRGVRGGAGRPRQDPRNILRS